MKRSLFALPVALVCCLGWWVSPPAGQAPTISADLANHPAGVHIHRAIVQGDAGALAAVRRGVHGLLRRELEGAMAIEVTDAQLDALKHNPLFTHLSGDLPVAGDMAITNQVTAAAVVWQSTPGLLGLGSTPGYTGNGVGVAILDSGIAIHTPLDSRVVAHPHLGSARRATAGDPFGHGTHLAGIVGGNRTAATYVTAAFAGGSAPSGRLIDVRVLGSTGSRPPGDGIAGIDSGIANPLLYT